MKVQVLGTGCEKCGRLEKAAKDAVKDLGIDAEVEKVQDIKEIMAFGVMSTPALAIDGVVKASGRVPSLDEIKKWLSGK